MVRCNSLAWAIKSGRLSMGEQVRIGLIGAGNIGQTYVGLLAAGTVQRAAITAVASRSGAGVADVPHFSDYRELLDSSLVDAVLVATPTMLHPEMAMDIAKRGIHCLMEKPLAMSVAQAERMIEAMPEHARFAVMLNQRYHPYYAALKTLLNDGAIGSLTRVSWTMTAWYRPDVYYEVSAWRGTWPGEGGGLLINQCIHNLDVLQWLLGLPHNVSALVGYGKHHRIDVEDEFTATLAYDNGATGVIIASSGEAPGINQLDIVGDQGTLRFDGDSLSLSEADQSVSEHCRSTSEMFGMPGFTSRTIEVGQGAALTQHAFVLQNFVDAVLDDIPLATPASAGLGSLQLANAIALSAWDQAPVELPIDAARYEQLLQSRVSASSLREPSERSVTVDMEQSFR